VSVPSCPIALVVACCVQQRQQRLLHPQACDGLRGCSAGCVRDQCEQALNCLRACSCRPGQCPSTSSRAFNSPVSP
jgi:hypothetical protein